MTAMSNLTAMTVGVWGGGRDGHAAASRCLEQGCEVVLISDDPATDEAGRRTSAELSVPLHHVDDIAGLGIGFLIRSPGISRYRPEVIALAKRSVESSNLFALWLADQPANKVIGVTGTKGKSTTATAIHGLFTAMGINAAIGGNIGVPVTHLDPRADVHVIEVSSYQASDCTTSPGIGVMTALGQDHISWHGTLAQYHRDKVNLFAHRQLRHMVFHDHDQVVRRALASVAADVKHFPAPVDIAHLDTLAAGTGAYERMGATTFPQNFLLAVTAVHAFGTPPGDDHLVAALEATAPLASRQDVIGVARGVEFVDDALASNPLAARAAIDRFTDKPCVVIVGGGDRHVDHSEYADSLNAAGHVRHVVVMGPADDPLAARIMPMLARASRSESDDVADAVAIALDVAEPGWRIIFSPAAPTPAHVGDYRTRSESFRAAMDRASSIS